ncbi:MAG TPA: hypothetical protein VFM93_00190 [Candidatus Limnocylindria bacterium]|nr:hypothetical protein [Candidatus Limnocylindria bacterium]
MHVDQVAYDRFVLDLPEVEGPVPLADSEVVKEAAAWLWEFGPTPIVGLVCYDGTPPAWLAGESARAVAFDGGPASVVVLSAREQLERFLAAGAPHQRTRLLWPRRSEAKLLEALVLGAGTRQWLEAIDAHAQVVREGAAVEVVQVS